MHSMHNSHGTEVVATDEFRDWYRSLDDGDGRAVARAVDRLEIMGMSLPFPHSSAIVGARYPLRELRIQSRGRPLRALYIFDARRDAVLLIGGDKTSDDRFYERTVPAAERLWEMYRAEQGFDP
jgi:hypothetical protein